MWINSRGLTIAVDDDSPLSVSINDPEVADDENYHFADDDQIMVVMAMVMDYVAVSKNPLILIMIILILILIRIIMVLIINMILRFWIVIIIVVDMDSVSKLRLTNSHITITGHYYHRSLFIQIKSDFGHTFFIHPSQMK